MPKNAPAPKPDTICAYLPSDGYRDRRATLHNFLEAREANVEGPAWEYVYVCSETGVERRWGLVERLVFTGFDEGN